MPQSGSGFRFVHSVAAVIQQLRLSLGTDAQKSLGDTAALLDDRDRQLEDYLSSLVGRISDIEGTPPSPGMPTGAIMDYAGVTPPAGYLLCNGSAVDRTTYADLFAAIGVTWGAGNGSTTFNLPDLRGRASIGAGTGTGLSARALAAVGGEETHVLTVPEMPAHTHTFTLTFQNAINADLTAGTWPINTMTSNTGSTGGGGAHNNMQPFAVVNRIIKT